MNAEPFQFDLEDFDDESAWAIPQHDAQLVRECWGYNRINIRMASIHRSITWNCYLYYRHGHE